MTTPGFDSGPPLEPINAVNLNGLQLRAATGVAGFALQDATPTILSWTAPNDGNKHRAEIFFSAAVQSAVTGGEIAFTYTLDGMNAGDIILLYANSMYTGTYPPVNPAAVMIDPGTTISVMQQSAMTGGDCIVWAEIWGS
jgi:hypothetical protein